RDGAWAPRWTRRRRPERHGGPHEAPRRRSEDRLDRPRRRFRYPLGSGRPPCRSCGRSAAPLEGDRPRSDRGGPAGGLSEKGLGEGDLVPGPPRTTHLPTDAALPRVSGHRALSVPEEDEAPASHPATEPIASRARSLTKIAIVSAKAPSVGPSGPGAMPVASPITEPAPTSAPWYSGARMARFPAKNEPRAIPKIGAARRQIGAPLGATVGPAS